MPIAQLKDPEVAADRVERFAGTYLRCRVRSRRHDAGLCPLFEMSLHQLSSGYH